MAFNLNIPVPVIVQRHRKHLGSAIYILALLCCVYILWDPEFVIGIFLPGAKSTQDTTNVQVESDDNFYSMLESDFKPAPKPIPEKVVHLPFIPKKHGCVNLFEKANHSFTYSEFYWEHSDAYKSALQMSGIMTEGNVDDASWLFHEIAMMPFIETVCETGFRAGHYSFHWLTAKPEIVVNSFESQKFNYTEDMATFMTAEFPDRFYFYPGDTVQTMPDFRKQNNETTCDLVFLDTSYKTDLEVMTDIDGMKEMKHPDQNMVILVSYKDNGNAQVAQGAHIWKKKVKYGEIVEQFSCDFEYTHEEMSFMNRRNNLEIETIFVGTFVNKKEGKS